MAWRIGVMLLHTTLFLARPLVGTDPWLPFGPWRMFATSQATTSAVWSSIEIGTNADPIWHPRPALRESTGLDRAEIEGRIPQIVAEQASLESLRPCRCPPPSSHDERAPLMQRHLLMMRPFHGPDHVTFPPRTLNHLTNLWARGECYWPSSMRP